MKEDQQDDDGSRPSQRQVGVAILAAPQRPGPGEEPDEEDQQNGGADQAGGHPQLDVVVVGVVHEGRIDRLQWLHGREHRLEAADAGAERTEFRAGDQLARKHRQSRLVRDRLGEPHQESGARHAHDREDGDQEAAEDAQDDAPPRAKLAIRGDQADGREQRRPREQDARARLHRHQPADEHEDDQGGQVEPGGYRPLAIGCQRHRQRHRRGAQQHGRLVVPVGEEAHRGPGVRVAVQIDPAVDAHADLQQAQGEAGQGQHHQGARHHPAGLQRGGEGPQEDGRRRDQEEHAVEGLGGRQAQGRPAYGKPGKGQMGRQLLPAGQLGPDRRRQGDDLQQRNRQGRQKDQQRDRRAANLQSRQVEDGDHQEREARKLDRQDAEFVIAVGAAEDAGDRQQEHRGGHGGLFPRQADGRPLRHGLTSSKRRRRYHTSMSDLRSPGLPTSVSH